MTNKLNTALVYFTTFVLLSSLVITPVSISSSYWGVAFAEEPTTETTIEQIQSLNVTSIESITTETTTEPTTEPVTEETTTEPVTEETTTEPVTEETTTEPVTEETTTEPG
ncbi:MAG: hypothetical protein IIB80_10135, partial [Thaumarchaeota archaeon]|nr:hypothetical protein [Nitrososphaerota archaeon]